MTDKKVAPPTRTYDLHLDGGVEITIGSLTTRELIDIQRGTMKESDALEMVVARIVSHNLDVDDLTTLEAWFVRDILGAWGEAIHGAAVPPESAAN